MRAALKMRGSEVGLALSGGELWFACDPVVGVLGGLIDLRFCLLLGYFLAQVIFGALWTLSLPSLKANSCLEECLLSPFELGSLIVVLKGHPWGA